MDSLSQLVSLSSIFLFWMCLLLLNFWCWSFSNNLCLLCVCPNPLFRVFGTLSRDRLILSGSRFFFFVCPQGQIARAAIIREREREREKKAQVWLPPAVWTKAPADERGNLICEPSCTWSNNCCCGSEDDSFRKQIPLNTCVDSCEACHHGHRLLSPTFVETNFTFVSSLVENCISSLVNIAHMVFSCSLYPTTLRRSGMPALFLWSTNVALQKLDYNALISNFSS